MGEKANNNSVCIKKKNQVSTEILLINIYVFNIHKNIDDVALEMPYRRFGLNTCLHELKRKTLHPIEKKKKKHKVTLLFRSYFKILA